MNTQEIHKKLADIGDVLAHILDPDHKESGLEIAVLKTSDTATSLKATLGNKMGFIKLFHDGTAATEAFGRERKALELLMGEQVPKLLFVAEVEQVVMTSFIPGKSLSETLTTDNFHQIAEHLGQWFGCVANKAPNVSCEGNWANYMDQYETGFETHILDHQRPILEQTRINKSVLSHNDNALGNFLIGEDKRLYGVDFAESRMKPEGWDLVTAARALIGRMPGALPIISGSLLRGYQLTAKECGLPDNFDQVISTVAFANAVKAA